MNKIATQQDIEDLRKDVYQIQDETQLIRRMMMLGNSTSIKVTDKFKDNFKLAFWNIVCWIATATLYLKGYDYIAYFFTVISFVMSLWLTAKLD